MKKKKHAKTLKTTGKVKIYRSRYWVVRHGKRGRDGECQLGPEAKVDIKKLVARKR